MLVLQETFPPVASGTPFCHLKSPTPLQLLDSGTVFRLEVSIFLIRSPPHLFRQNKKRKRPTNRLKTPSMHWKIESGASIPLWSIKISQRRKPNKFQMRKILKKLTKSVKLFPPKPPTCTLVSKKLSNWSHPNPNPPISTPYFQTLTTPKNTILTTFQRPFVP